MAYKLIEPQKYRPLMHDTSPGSLRERFYLAEDEETKKRLYVVAIDRLHEDGDWRELFVLDRHEAFLLKVSLEYSITAIARLHEDHK